VALPFIDRWRAWRDAKLASPVFQRWAADFPLTRPVAERRARGLFDITAGFVYSQILFACVELSLFDKLAARARTAADLAPEMGMDPVAAERLLRAAVAIDLLERRGTNAGGDIRYGLGKLGVAMPGNPGIAAMVRHHRMLYHDLDDPLALFRGELKETELGRYWSYAGSEQPAADGDDRVAEYSTLMSASSGFVAEDTLDAYSLKDHRCLMDVGGGEGRFLIHGGERWPHLRLMLFDLPAVVARAEGNFREAGMADRARMVGGDIKADGLARGCRHHFPGARHPRPQRRRRDGHPARGPPGLAPGGTLLITEPMSETPGVEPVGDAYFGLYLLAMGSGRTRPPREHRAMLETAGFGDIRFVRTRRPLQTRLVVAKA
jgi:demethylspheroidene O-methyltransferase